MIYTLTHRKENPEGEYDHVEQGAFTEAQLIQRIISLGDLAYQYYVTEWETNDSLNENHWDMGEQANADEWLEDIEATR